MGRLSLLAQPRERRRALAHLALAFPDRDEAWRRGVVRAAARHFGQVLAEVVWLWSASPEAILARTEIVGLENLTAPLGPDGGSVLVTGHCGNWEWMNLALGAAGVPMTVAAREVYDPRLDDIVRLLRGRFGGETVLRGQGAGQRLSRALRDGRVLGLLIDQDIETPGVDAVGRRRACHPLAAAGRPRLRPPAAGRVVPAHLRAGDRPAPDRRPRGRRRAPHRRAHCAHRSMDPRGAQPMGVDAPALAPATGA